MFCSFSLRNVYFSVFVVLAHAFLILAALFFYKPSATSLPSNILLVGILSSPQKASTLSHSHPIKKDSSTVLDAGRPQPSASAVSGFDGAQQHAGSKPARHKVHGPKPLYPLISRRLREKGAVLIKLCVDPRGSVQNIEVLESSGYANLDQSALSALSQWKFSALDNPSSEVVDCFRMPVQFTLEG